MGVPRRGQRLAQLIFGEFRVSPWRTILMLRRPGLFLVGRGFRVRGGKNISATAPGSILSLGIRAFHFADNRVTGLLRVRGLLRFSGSVSVGSGNRWDIGPGATMTVGEDSYFSPSTMVVISSGLTIGTNCAVGWNVQFLDDDFHSSALVGGELKPSSIPIVIGDNVWIGSHSKIFKGVRIANGCVVAGNSTVTRSFPEENCLIGGSPARVIRHNSSWV